MTRWWLRAAGSKFGVRGFIPALVCFDFAGGDVRSPQTKHEKAGMNPRTPNRRTSHASLSLVRSGCAPAAVGRLLARRTGGRREPGRKPGRRRPVSAVDREEPAAQASTPAVEPPTERECESLATQIETAARDGKAETLPRSIRPRCPAGAGIPGRLDARIGDKELIAKMPAGSDLATLIASGRNGGSYRLVRLKKDTNGCRLCSGSRSSMAASTITN